MRRHQLGQGRPTICDSHGLAGLIPFLQIFFAVWWAWMNFTWFASSYDTDDVAYRLLTMVQMAGVLVLAAGVPTAGDHSDYRTVTLGYFVMRIGLVSQWVRAAVEDPRRPPHHIAERYGLFTIILLGESVLAASRGVAGAVETSEISMRLVVIAVSGLVLLFAFWWLYFLAPAGAGLSDHRHRSYLWGYGHYGIFAALGAGLEVTVERTGHDLRASDLAVVIALTRKSGRRRSYLSQKRSPSGPS